MGFWKKFAKIAIPIGAAVAAPFTGGASLAALGAGAGAAEGALSGGGWKGALLGAGLGGATAGLGSGLGGSAGGAAGSAASGATKMGLGSTILKNIPQIASSLGPALSSAAAGSANQRIAEAPAIANAYEANLKGTQLGDKRAILASLLGGVQDASVGRPAGSTIPTFSITGGLRPSALGDRSGLISRLGTPIKPLELPTAGKLEKILGGVGLAGNILNALPNFGHKDVGPVPTGTPPILSSLPGTPNSLPTSPKLLPQAPQSAGIFNPSQLPFSLGDPFSWPGMGRPGRPGSF